MGRYNSVFVPINVVSQGLAQGKRGGHFHRGQTQKPTLHPAVIALKNLYQFKSFMERSS